jgi:predicted ATPase
VRAAIDWLLKHDDHRTQGICLTSQSSPLWFVLGLMEDYRGLAERALEMMRGYRRAVQRSILSAR